MKVGKFNFIKIKKLFQKREGRQVRSGKNIVSDKNFCSENVKKYCQLQEATELYSCLVLCYQTFGVSSQDLEITIVQKSEHERSACAFTYYSPVSSRFSSDFICCLKTDLLLFLSLTVWKADHMFLNHVLAVACLTYQ